MENIAHLCEGIYHDIVLYVELHSYEYMYYYPTRTYAHGPVCPVNNFTYSIQKKNKVCVT